MLFKRLKRLAPEAVFLGPEEPFRVLIFTIISQRTRDEQTAVASERLLSVFPTVKELAQAEVEDIERLIEPAGFYRVKARKIKELCRILLERYNGNVPDNFESLMELPSVGRKTANCVLVFGFGKPAIPVDTHVHRISNRLGWVETNQPEQTEVELTHFLPKKYWIEINELLVRFGQEVCRPIGPKCPICTLNDICPTGSEMMRVKKGKK